MKIYVTSLFVDDQDHARRVYTEALGFRIRHDIPLGEGPDAHHWLTVVSGEDTGEAPDGPELLLEPSDHPAVGPYRAALRADGIPAHSFQVTDLDAEHARLVARGLSFVTAPVAAGPVRMAVFDDTCGNLVQLIEMQDAPGDALGDGPAN